MTSTIPLTLYDDKMVITFHYEDGDKCVTFDEINEMLKQKETPITKKIIRVRFSLKTKADKSLENVVFSRDL